MANVTGWWAEVSTAASVPRMSATALLKPPTVSSVSPLNPSPPRMSATATMATPGVSLSTTITIPRMTATGSMAVPTVSNAVNAALTAPRMSATAALPIPAVSVWGDVAPPRMTSTGALATPVVATLNGAHYTDNFNRSNSSTLGASWTTAPDPGTSLEITGNAATDNGSASGNVYASTMDTDDQAVSVVMKGSAVDDVALIALRVNSSSATQYVFALLQNGSPWSVYPNISGVGGATTSGNQSWADGDTIIFQVKGTATTLKLNGSTLLTSTATVTTGRYVALNYVSASTPHGFDSFDAQDI